MARGRIKLARIINETKRRYVLKLRTKAVFKRLEKLCVLCNVEACMVLFDGPGDLGTNDPMVWPSREKAVALVSRFMNIPQEVRSAKAVVNQKFLKDLVAKETLHLQKLKMKNDKMEMEEILHQLVEGAPELIEAGPAKMSLAYFYIEDLIKEINTITKERPSQVASKNNVAS